MSTHSLDLGLIGNGTIAALLNSTGDIVWSCFPRFDGDPVFCSLLRNDEPAAADGVFAIDIVDLARTEQEYSVNTPVLVTRAFDSHGGAIEITDFAPRFRQYGRVFSPVMLIRRVRRLSGSPKIRVRLRPTANYGMTRTRAIPGSNHIRFDSGGLALRLTTDAAITAIMEENTYLLHDTNTFIFAADETIHSSIEELGARFLAETTSYWREWVRTLAIPFEWQDEVIRAAITLKLNVFEDTGAIIAAVTTSIPEAPKSGRNWDYRFCWLRDAYFVVDALNRLGATRSMERYLDYILNIVGGATEGVIHPLYTVTGRPVPDETVAEHLAGYLGMGPVRVGNQARDQIQHDIYGAVILAAPHAFFDRRLIRRGDHALFSQLEAIGERAAANYNKPDAGLWELRGKTRVHTFSSAMCWAGCERLARIAAHIGLPDRAKYWRATADRIQAEINERCYNKKLETFTATMDGDVLDASMLRLAEIGFVSDRDPRFANTVTAIEKNLRRGDFIFRYSEADDFGEPENAFLVCTFWYIKALARLGRKEEARELFESILARRNPHGLLAEDIDQRNGEQWGNFPQTYSMVGIIDVASRLSKPWDEAY
jgi:GH15 family glucan-1,4-alpha-glucosidase